MSHKFYHDRPFVAMATKRNCPAKNGYNSPCIRDISKILRLTGGIRGQAIERCQLNFRTTDPDCHSNKIVDIMAIT